LWILLPADRRVGTTPPVMDLPLYTTVLKSELPNLGSFSFHKFNHYIVLDSVMRQAGNKDTQQMFCVTQKWGIVGRRLETLHKANFSWSWGLECV